MSNELYEILWVSKNATKDEIKKAYKKKAMEYHPDRNKNNPNSEEMFKKVNWAYDTLSDENKRKQYDMFWSTWSAWFWWWNTYWWWAGWFSWFEDIFSNMWWWAKSRNSWFEFNIEDLFWWMWWNTRTSKNSYTQEKKEENLDFEKIYEVPVFDLILWCKIEVSWVYWQKAKLKIPANTKPWSKFRVKDFWKSEWTRKWNLIVKIETLMPKNISEVDLQLLERIRENVWY